MKRSPNPRRREPYRYDATGEQYTACIRLALAGGRVPRDVLKFVYHILLPYMHG